MTDFNFLFTKIPPDSNNVKLFSDQTFIRDQIENIFDIGKYFDVYFDENQQEGVKTRITDVSFSGEEPFFKLDIAQNELANLDLSAQVVIEIHFERIPLGFATCPGKYKNGDDRVYFSFPDTIYRLQRRKSERYDLTLKDGLFLEFLTTNGDVVKSPVVALGKHGLGFLLKNPFNAQTIGSDDELEDELVFEVQKKEFELFLFTKEQNKGRVLAEYLYESQSDNEEMPYYVGIRFQRIDPTAESIVDTLLKSKKQMS